jgi:putative flippase GtrA
MNKTKRQIHRFLFAGISAVATDLISYYILLEYVDPAAAKTLSFLLGTIVAYIINKYWTFEKHVHSYIEIVKFTVLYASTLVVNVTANEIILNQSNMVLMAFLVATGISTILNFIGQKWWVFK